MYSVLVDSLADLLSHRAGILPFTSGIEYRSIPDSITGYSGHNERELFSKWILTQNPVIDGDKNYIYSNAGYSVAATMLEKASGISFQQIDNNCLIRMVKKHRPPEKKILEARHRHLKYYLHCLFPCSTDLVIFKPVLKVSLPIIRPIDSFNKIELATTTGCRRLFENDKLLRYSMLNLRKDN